MIISKEPHLTDSQLREIEALVAEYRCTIHPIHGAHRSIYAIIGDETSELMFNRLEGLDYVDKVDRVESIYKLMDIRSELARHRVVIGGHTLGNGPFIAAGQCTIDPKNPNYFYETAQAVKEAGAHALRGGVWKPRTTPHSFQGDNRSMDILVEGRARSGLPVVTEVMDEEQLRIAVDAAVDVIQIGTRNALNYSLLKQVGKLTAGKKCAVLLKRARNMGPIDEFISAAEYIVAGGNPNVVLCPRGTMPGLDIYRNHPDESVTPLLKKKTWAPVVADPSHSVGKAEFVPACALSALIYGADGIIVESHCEPSKGIGDDPKQALNPASLRRLIQDAQEIWKIRHR